MQLLQKVLEKIPIKPKAHQLQDFVSQAISLAWSMVTLQPPMVIDTQEKFDDEHHERQHGYWSEDRPSDPMQYFRPTLFRSCMGELAEKAWVSNCQGYKVQDQ